MICLLAAVHLCIFVCRPQDISELLSLPVFEKRGRKYGLSEDDQDWLRVFLRENFEEESIIAVQKLCQQKHVITDNVRKINKERL